MPIPIENIYYLLCYAWNKLDEQDRVAVSVTDETILADLFAKVLINGSKLLLKRGIAHEYIETTQELAGIKGKLQLSDTLKANLLAKQKTCCFYDEFSGDILLNQILVSTMVLMIKIKSLDPQLKKELKQLAWMFGGISRIQLGERVFQQIKLNRNNYFYGFILNICQIVYENSLPTEQSGVYQFVDFTRDELKMNKLFEAFIRNFYKTEYGSRFSVKSEMIKWKFASSDQDCQRYLPLMLTDITLENEVEKIIIDAKYYNETMALNYDKEKIKSVNLYQLFSYLLNQETSESKTLRARGILLYPTVDKDYDLEYKYQSHPIAIKTVNLNQHWREIDSRLKKIINYGRQT